MCVIWNLLQADSEKFLGFEITRDPLGAEVSEERGQGDETRYDEQERGKDRTSGTVGTGKDWKFWKFLR